MKRSPSPSLPSATDALLRKLDTIVIIGDAERQALAALPVQVEIFKARHDIVQEGQQPTRCFFVIDGVACTNKTTTPGKRQIQALHMRGDLLDVASLHLKTLDYSVSTITACTIAFVPHEALLDICTRFPAVAIAFWSSTLVDAAVFREWITNAGRRDARSAMAHLLCEQVVRLKAVGAVPTWRCNLSLTQEDLGDALGLSAVHVNRTLRELRAEEVLTLTRATLTILDWERLKVIGDFNPRYLHLRSPVL